MLHGISFIVNMGQIQKKGSTRNIIGGACGGVRGGGGCSIIVRIGKYRRIMEGGIVSCNSMQLLSSRPVTFGLKTFEEIPSE